MGVLKCRRVRAFRVAFAVAPARDLPSAGGGTDLRVGELHARARALMLARKRLGERAHARTLTHAHAWVWARAHGFANLPDVGREGCG